MEEVDLIPDERCRLVAKNFGWTNIDESIWSKAKHLLYLDISHNSLESLPSRIGDLFLLIEFNCSCNKIKNLPTEIGKLSKLKVLKAEGNQISLLPDEIGQCSELEELILSENSLKNIPDSVAECLSLKILHLQNNNLQSLPKKLTVLKNRLEELDVSNNPELTMIPVEYRRNLSVILWILSLHYEKTKEVQQISQVTRQLNAFYSKSQQKMEEAEQRLQQLEKEREALLAMKEANRYYISFCQYLRKCRDKMKMLREPHIYY
jgi:Leucine-rich repeat (LRR) protein